MPQPTTPTADEPVELVPAVVENLAFEHGQVGDALVPVPVPAQAAVVPTQMRHPLRSVLRGAVQNFVGLCSLLLLAVEILDIDVSAGQLPWLAVPIVVAAGVTRLMADPRVEKLLRALPIARWLSAAPAPPE